jgi:aldehyde:ferredoxin oxidoreductase
LPLSRFTESPKNFDTFCQSGYNHGMEGYHGRYLHIDLCRPSGEFLSLPTPLLRSFLGGSGLGTALLLRHGAAECEPLSPEATIAFVFSSLVGSPLTTSAKFAVVSKSPLTQRINDSLASSSFAIAGKRTGADAILITGRAPSLSVLVIDDGNVRLDDAAPLAGLSCRMAKGRLRETYGPHWSFAVIGPAGERQVRYATISHDGRHAGRGGSGAVLGAKNIKAIAVRGSQRVAWAEPERLTALAKDLSQRSFGPATAKYRELGTATNLLTFNRLHALPTRNFQSGSFVGAEQIAPETLSIARGKTRASCAACTIGCEHIYELSPGGAGVRVEYENLFALGPLCGVSDPQKVLAASQRCDDLGIDTISAGGTIAFAMECVERGLLHEPWLRFGDGHALLKALDLIGTGEGLGEMLSQGSRRMAEVIGNDSLDFAPQVKGLEIPGYEPRALQTMALGFAVGSRGADHNRSGAYEADFSDQADRRQLSPQSAALAIETENKAALMDSLILCKFLRGVFSDFYQESANMLRLVTGWDVTADELRQTAQSIVAAKKLFNIRAGWQPAEDTLPPRMLAQALSDDALARLTLDQLDAARRAYNLGRGWSAEGWLSEQTCADLTTAVSAS